MSSLCVCSNVGWSPLLILRLDVVVAFGETALMMACTRSTEVGSVTLSCIVSASDVGGITLSTEAFSAVSVLAAYEFHSFSVLGTLNGFQSIYQMFFLVRGGMH